MFRIAALNDSSSESSNDEELGPSAEALEAEATRVYQKAIFHIAKSELEEGKAALFEVLNNPYISKARWKDGERPKSLPQDVAIKYSCYKSLGSIYLTQKQYHDACDAYLKALHLDSTEVTLWHKLGVAAIKIKDFQLALIAFQEGLLISPTHWMCLDQMLSVLFLLGFHEDCLALAIHTLRRDPNYIKALAFKDQIFEKHPSLVDYVKKFLKGSDILFREVSYDRSKGDKFIETCLQLRPSPKEPRPTSPISSTKLTKHMETFAWHELAQSLISTYDHLINEEESKAFVCKLEFEHILKEYVDQKLEDALQEKVKNNLPLVFKPGRRLSRSLSYNDEILCNHQNGEEVGEVGNAVKSLPSQPQKESEPPKRRQTIELGEGQESFRVGSRQQSPILPSKETENTTLVEQEEEKEYIQPTLPSDQTPLVAEKCFKVTPCSIVQTTNVGTPLESEAEIRFEEDPKVDGDISHSDHNKKSTGPQVLHRTHEERENSSTTAARASGLPTEDELMTGETQAAVDQLKDIMAMKPPTQILNLSGAGFEYDQDFCDYFDGGVYEEDDDDDDDDDDEEEEEEMEVIISENSQSIDERGQAGRGGMLVTGTEDKANREDIARDRHLNTIGEMEKLFDGNVKPQLQRGMNEGGIGPCSTLPIPNGQSCLPSETATPDATSKKSPLLPPKKQKRAKRGLERELEQLDYWGRRKAREAKKRRRTLTSRLVGVFEESEYLTWAHVIRSFIPAALLSPEVCSESKKPKETNCGQDCSKEAPKTDPSLSTKAEHSDGVSPVKEAQPNEVLLEKDIESFKFIKEYGNFPSYSHWMPEELEVGEFLHELKQNGGVLHVMQCNLEKLLERYNKVWPQHCAIIYKDLYLRIRKHITVGAALSPSIDDKSFRKFGVAALVNIELLLCLGKPACMDASSPSSKEVEVDLLKMLEDESLFLEDDLFHLQLLLARPDVWKEDYLQAHLRLLWIQSQIMLLKGQPEDATFHLQMLIEYMILSTEENREPLKIETCHLDENKEELTIPFLKNQLNMVQRSQMIENIEAKFSCGHYLEVIQIITSTFVDTRIRLEADSTYLSRRSQLVILMESLVHMADWEGIILWGGSCLKEAIEQFQLNESNDEERNEWSDTTRTLLLLIWKGFAVSATKGDIVSEDDLGKLTSSLVNILVIQLEQGSSLSEPYFKTLTPWMILHRALSLHEEKQATRNSSKETLKTVPDEPVADGNEGEAQEEKGTSAAPSTLLLITAHEELGKNSWCCIEEGKFLLYMLDVLVAEFDNPLSEEQKVVIHQSVEQIMFCLFSHPSRKTKYKHLRDHGGKSIPLSWKRALQLYKYYLPPQLPGFQSSQIPSITDDVAVLFRRIISLMPDVYKHPDQTKLVDGYIEGELPGSDLVPLDFPQELKDCYYLLADSYFKGKEWEQAVHYYKMDASINPNRFDSWAPMGLAKKAQLETLLNSCDVIRNDEEFFKEARRAARCVERALHLDPYYSILWVEKGSLVYMVHSHASRLLKQDLNPDMSIEMFEALENIKTEMLKESSRCFSEASRIVEEGWEDEELPDERWLYQYMLGKLAEKTGNNPAIVIGRYLDAFKRLHLIGANYPPQINYNDPAELSVEALEIFFRINVYVFKYLNQREGKDIEPRVLKLFKTVISNLLESPFVLMEEMIESEPAVDMVALSPEVIINMNENTKKRPASDEDSPSSGKKAKRDNCASENPYKAIEDALKVSLKEDKSGKEGPETMETDKIDKVDSVESVEHINKEREELVMKCVDAFKLCVSRFPHHYKSLYRLAYFYHYSKSHKDNIKARNILLGCEAWQQLNYMPSGGLFSDRKIFPMSLKNSNLFHGVWRIPHDEIDRPGSFAAHMYRCVSLCLDILHETKDFYSVLEIAISLRGSPEKEKKYLRDNERELLSEHATLVGIQTMKDKYKFLFHGAASVSPPPKAKCHAFLVDAYKAHKQMSRHLTPSDSPFSKMLVDAYAAMKGVAKESNPNLIREAENFCVRNPSTLQGLTVSDPGGNGGNNGTTPASTNISISYPGHLKPQANIERRGRPPGSSRESDTLHRYRSSHDTSPTVGQTMAVQQAYKVYENLIQAQTILNNKKLEEKSLQYYQGKYEEYKQQMLKYLQIPSVSQFFHSSLQSLGTSSAKLPPPPPSSNVANSTSEKTSCATSSSAAAKPSISTLAARSKAHGISISSVSKRPELSPTKLVKPSMSIIMSQSKNSQNTSSFADGKGPSVSLSSNGAISSAKHSSTGSSTDPLTTNSSSSKLPVLTSKRQEDTTNSSHKDLGGVKKVPAEEHKDSTEALKDSSVVLKDSTAANKNSSVSHKDPCMASKDFVCGHKDSGTVHKESGGGPKDLTITNEDIAVDQKNYDGSSKDPTHVHEVFPGNAEHDIVKLKDTTAPTMTLHSHSSTTGTATITQTSKQAPASSGHSSRNSTKKQHQQSSTISFQDAFQASLAKLNMASVKPAAITPVNANTASVSGKPAAVNTDNAASPSISMEETKQGIGVPSSNQLKTGDNTKDSLSKSVLEKSVDTTVLSNSGSQSEIGDKPKEEEDKCVIILD